MVFLWQLWQPLDQLLDLRECTLDFVNGSLRLLFADCPCGVRYQPQVAGGLIDHNFCRLLPLLRRSKASANFGVDTKEIWPVTPQCRRLTQQPKALIASRVSDFLVRPTRKHASAVFPSDASALCNLLDMLTGQLEFGTDGFEGQ